MKPFLLTFYKNATQKYVVKYVAIQKSSKGTKFVPSKRIRYTFGSDCSIIKTEEKDKNLPTILMDK